MRPDAGGHADGDRRSDLTNGGARLTNGPARLTSGGARLTNDPARLTSGGARLTNDPARLTSGGARLTNDPASRTRAPAGKPRAPAGKPRAPAGRPRVPAGKGRAPAGRPRAPAGRPRAPAGKGRAPAGKVPGPLGRTATPPASCAASGHGGRHPVPGPAERSPGRSAVRARRSGSDPSQRSARAEPLSVAPLALRDTMIPHKYSTKLTESDLRHATARASIIVSTAAFPSSSNLFPDSSSSLNTPPPLSNRPLPPFPPFLLRSSVFKN
jgi:hypothetical protein